MPLRLTALLLALIAFTTTATAANFPGWTRSYEPKAVTITSPQDANGMVNFMLGAAEREDGDPKAEFRKSVDEAIRNLGGDFSLTQRSGIQVQGGLMVESMKIAVQGGNIDMLVFAYDTGSKIFQAGALAYVSTLADSDPRVNHALDFIATAVRTKYRMTDPRAFDRTAPQAQSVTTYTTSQSASPPPAPPVATPAPPVQQSGKRCERRAIWGFRVSYWCQPSGICPDRVIKGYETVCE
jgi:hypothetical protein